MLLLRPSLCSKNVMHLKTLFRHSGAAHNIKCCWGGISLQGRGYPESEICQKFHHFLDLASVNKITWCYIKYSFKNPPVLSQSVQRRDTEKNSTCQLYYSTVFLGSTSPEAIRTIENDKERKIFAEFGLHTVVCYHFCLKMSSERIGKTVKPGVQGYKGGLYVLEARELFLCRVI